MHEPLIMATRLGRLVWIGRFPPGFLPVAQTTQQVPFAERLGLEQKIRALVEQCRVLRLGNRRRNDFLCTHRPTAFFQSRVRAAHLPGRDAHRDGIEYPEQNDDNAETRDDPQGSLSHEKSTFIDVNQEYVSEFGRTPSKRLQPFSEAS